MRIIDLLDKKSVTLNLVASTKIEAIDKMVDLVENSGNLNNKEEYKKAIIAREEMSTTGIGEGVAIPHAKTKAVDKACLAAGVSKDGIDYESFDGSLSHLFFMIAAPDGANDTHLEVLSRLSTILMDEEFRNNLINTTSIDEFISLIDKNYCGNIKDVEKADMNDSLQIGASIPGKVVKILVKENEQVKQNQPLIIIEAMKMETVIVSKVEGTINSIKVSQDEIVCDKQLLIIMN